MGRDSADEQRSAAADHADGAAPRHEVLTASAGIRAEAARLIDAAGRAWSLSDAELRAAVAAGAAARSATDAAFLSLVKALDDRPGAAGGMSSVTGGSAPSRGARRFLVEALRFSPAQAAQDVAAAHALDADTGDLPAVGAALRDGEITRGHADAAVRVARDLPRRLATVVDAETGLTGMATADAFLAEHSRTQGPRTVAWLGEQLLARLAPDRADRYDPDAVLRRTASRVWDSTGMLRGTFQMDGAAGAAFTAVWDRLSAPLPQGTADDEQGEQLAVRDERSAGMRMVDALSAMSRLAATALGVSSGPSGGRAEAPTDAPASPAQVMVVATVEQVAAAGSVGPEALGVGFAQQHAGNRGPIPGWLLSRLACDGGLQRVLVAGNGAVLDLGRRVRLASPGQRRALTVRDGGCVIPGCTAPPEHCDVHHVVPWSRGGPTDLGNLALTCPRHHTAVHAGHWRLRIRDAAAWAISPPWIDPRQRPVRNTTHRTAHTARRLGEQLSLLLDQDEGPGPPGAQDQSIPGQLSEG